MLLILVAAVAGCAQQPAEPALPPAIPQMPVIRPELIQNCDALAEMIAGIPGTKLTRSVGSFEDEIGSSTKYGCVLKTEGSFKALGNEDLPPDVRIARFAESKGWETDSSRSADGPDGTVFAFRPPAAWCLVTGKWDGGDDSDPTYVPDDKYQITIGCALH